MRLLFLSLTLLASTSLLAGVFVYEGIYQGKDLYVKNPFSSDGVGFCVFEVKVNGEVTTDEVNSSAFAIDLSLFDFRLGDPVEIVIRTKDGCQPTVINPEDITPKSTFQLEKMSLRNDETLVFTTSNELGALPFIVEQFKWNKWVQVATVEGMGAGKNVNTYEVAVPVHSGDNTFRIRQNDDSGTHLTDRKSFSSNKPAVQLTSEKVYDALNFSTETSYEVFDAYGVLRAKGAGKTVDTSNWKKGEYFVNFGNTFGVTVNKR